MYIYSGQFSVLVGASTINGVITYNIPMTAPPSRRVALGYTDL